MKTITIAGNITKDAVLRRTQSGEPVTGFSVAVNDNRTKQALFFDCSLFGRRAEALTGYLTTGSKVCVTGEMGKREHDGKTYLTVNVSEVTLMGAPQQRQDDGYRAPQRVPEPPRGKPPAGSKPASWEEDLDDSVPF